MMVGRLLSHWEGIFSGAMLNFGTVKFEWNMCMSLCRKRKVVALEHVTFCRCLCLVSVSLTLARHIICVERHLVFGVNTDLDI